MGHHGSYVGPLWAFTCWTLTLSSSSFKRNFHIAESGLHIFVETCRPTVCDRAIYTVSQKKGATLTMAITLSILGGFAKFFHCWKDQ